MMTMANAPAGTQPADDAMVALATTARPEAILQASGMATNGEDQFTHDVDDRAKESHELTGDSVQQAHAIPRPSVAPDSHQEAVGDVEDDGHNDVVPDNEAVSLPNDLTAAGDHSAAETQPGWGVAPDEFHAGSHDEAEAEDDSPQPDISGGEADGSADCQGPEVEGVSESDTAETLSPNDSEAGTEAAAKLPTDEAGDKAESPQPYRRTPLPSDVDWRDLKPRCYGNALPPLDSSERQGLKASIVNRGFLGKILIDEWLAIIDGNTRWEICLKTGITPEVEVIEGLSDEEKEELAFSFNADRRQLKDPEVEQQVLDARFENLFKLQEQDPKKWTQDRIADALGVSRATVSARLQSRHISNGGNVSKPDARRRYEADVELEAVRLVKEGKPPSVVARMLLMHSKAVQRAVNKEKRRAAGGAAAKGNKSEKAAATQSTEDLAANDGVPKIHRAALDRLGKNAHDYDDWLEDGFADAQKEITAAADNVEKVLKLAISASQLLAAANLWLKSNCGDGDEADVEESPPGDLYPDGDRNKPGTILLGTVMDVGEDEVLVALPDGGGGVIDNRDNCLAKYGPLDEGKAYRVRVEGFDPDRNLVILQPLGRQTAMPAAAAAASSPSLDEGPTTDAEAAADETDVETTEVTK